MSRSMFLCIYQYTYIYHIFIVIQHILFDQKFNSDSDQQNFKYYEKVRIQIKLCSYDIIPFYGATPLIFNYAQRTDSCNTS